MAHSSLLGIDRVPGGAPGHDTASLGPSDTSDSGSDLAGVEEFDDADAMLPVDVAIAADRPHPDSAVESLEGGSDSDAGGTGERRSVGGDGSFGDGADISPDRIVAHPDAGLAEDDLDSLVEAIGDGDADADLLTAVAEDDGSDAEFEGDEDGQSADASIPRRRRR